MRQRDFDKSKRKSDRYIKYAWLMAKHFSFTFGFCAIYAKRDGLRSHPPDKGFYCFDPGRLPGLDQLSLKRERKFTSRVENTHG